MTIHALTMCDFGNRPKTEPKGCPTPRIGKRSEWWHNAEARKDIVDPCPLHCSEPREYEIAPSLFVCQRCWELDRSS